jgi:flagellar assembly protein FliH
MDPNVQSPESVIAAEDLNTCERWELPTMRDRDSGRASPQPMTASKLEALQKAAYEEAYEKGRAEGFAEGAREARSVADSLNHAIQSLEQPFSELNHEVEEQLVSLSIAIARQLIRRELRTAPEEIIATIRAALHTLPAASRDVQVVVNPEDRALILETLGVAAESWDLVDNPSVTRGGCRIESHASRIDATVETRMSGAIAQVLGGERSNDDV